MGAGIVKREKNFGIGKEPQASTTLAQHTMIKKESRIRRLVEGALGKGINYRNQIIEIMLKLGIVKVDKTELSVSFLLRGDRFSTTL